MKLNSSDSPPDQSLTLRMPNTRFDFNSLAFKVGQLLASPDRLVNMRANTLRLARPLAAQTVVNTLLDESHNIPPFAFSRDQRLKMSVARRSQAIRRPMP